MNELEDILGIKFPDNCEVSHVTNTSKKVKKDSIFFGLQGINEHGSKYAHEAINHGASLVVHNDKNIKISNKKIFYVKDLENLLIKFLNSFYGIDINVNNFFTFTGTNGKTSSAFLCHQLLTNMGYESIYIGTIGIQHNKKELKTSFSSKTTPDIFELFEIIHSCNWAMDSLNICIEISSHALDQKRLRGINDFYSASLLNIEDDHLDYHKNITSYIDAKFKIFKTNSTARLIQENLLKFKKEFEFLEDPNKNLTSISSTNHFADIFFGITAISLKKSEFYIQINKPPKNQEHEKGKKYRFECNLFPEFNISNLIYSICSIGFDEFSEDTVNDLSFLKLPTGRSEFIKNISANVIVDYAHNENGIKFFLNSIEKYFDNLITIFGCGGDRDIEKRSKMLKSAIENSSKVIFTSDNVRNETFEKIFNDAKKGNNLESVIAIKNRKEAILQGTKMIKGKDCLVILGKGHEQFQEVDGRQIKYSDFEVIDEIYS